MHNVADAPAGPVAGSGRGAPQRDEGDVPGRARLVGYAAAAWCLGFAAVNARDVVSGPGPDHELRAYASGLALMSALVLVLKVLGAYVAWASIRPAGRRAGILGAPLLLGGVLVAPPRFLASFGLFPS